MPSYLQTPRILWLALIVSVALYGLVLTQVPAPVDPPPPPIPSIALWVLSAALVFASVFAVPLWGRSMQRQAVARDPARPEQAAMRAYFTSFIVRMAVAEAVALLGFVDAFTTGRHLDYASSGVLAALVMMWHFPTQRRLLGR